MEDWQAKRAAEKAGTGQGTEEEVLRRQLDRGPAPAAAPSPAPAQYIVRGRGRKSQWPLAKPLAIIILVAVVLAALHFHGELGSAREFLDRDMSKGLPLYRVYPLSTEFKVNRLLSTTCRGGQVDYFLDVAIPNPITSQQEVVELAETPAPTRTTGSYWNWTGQLTGGEQLAVTISYHARAYYYQWDLKAKDSGTTAQVAGYTQYLGDCWKFTPDEPAIKSLAAELAGNTTNVLEKVINVYQWVHANIAYMGNSPAEPKTPLQTLADRAGDCDDQSFFMGSLLRSQGVPAWMELGMLYDQSTSQWGGHAWMRVFIPLAEGGGRVVNIDPANNEFLFRDSFRMTDYIDDGSATNLHNYYILWRYTYTGAPPLREDRLDSIEFTQSSDTAGVTGSGPSLTGSTPGKLWRAPGFELVLAVPAAAVSMILLGRRNRLKD